MTMVPVSAMSGAEMVELCKRHTIYEWSAQSTIDPIPVARAEGVYFWTPEGKRYLDFNSQLMCTNIGHGHPAVIRAIQEQAATLAYANPFMATEARARLGVKLAAIAPGDIDHFFFTNGGAEANENAIRIARTVTGRPEGAGALPRVPRRDGRAPSRSPAIRAAGAPSPAFPASSARPSSTSGGAGIPSRSTRRWPISRTSSATKARTRSRRSSWSRSSAPTGCCPARRLHAGRARPLRPPRHPADRRRGDVGVWTHGPVVRRGPLGHRPRPDHDGQGADVRLRAARRGGHAAGDRARVRGPAVPRRAHLQQPSARVRGGAGDDRACTKTRAWSRTRTARWACGSASAHAGDGAPPPVGRRDTLDRALRAVRAGAEPGHL